MVVWAWRNFRPSAVISRDSELRVDENIFGLGVGEEEEEGSERQWGEVSGERWGEEERGRKAKGAQRQTLLLGRFWGFFQVFS